MEIPVLSKELFEKMLADFYEVHLMVEHHPDVVLPETVASPAWRRGEVIVHLLYGLDLANPITDWEIDERGVGAVLSFDKIPCRTFVPWGAVVIAQARGPRAPEPPNPARPRLFLVR
jgi:hypothetical protein